MSEKGATDKQLANAYILTKFKHIEEGFSEELLADLNGGRRMAATRKERIRQRVVDWLDKKGKPLGDYLVKQGVTL